LNNTSRLLAPIAMRMPISHVRSVTETGMMFITPKAPLLCSVRKRLASVACFNESSAHPGTPTRIRNGRTHTPRRSRRSWSSARARAHWGDNRATPLTAVSAGSRMRQPSAPRRAGSVPARWRRGSAGLRSWPDGQAHLRLRGCLWFAPVCLQFELLSVARLSYYRCRAGRLEKS
jgi:hypothetical protein